MPLTLSLSFVQSGTTPLILAASKGPVCVIELLLQKGAEVDATNKVTHC
jgi:ankyrin repeat protein